MEAASTYRAVHAAGPGRLELTERTFQTPGPGKVRIRVEACGVCHSDAGTVEGLSSSHRYLPDLNTGSKEMTMPLWKVYHPVGAYTREDKHAFSKRITEIYSQVPLPKFYVDVVFQEIPQDSFYIGGEPARNFVRIHMDHIARQLTSEAAKTKFLARVEDAIAPFVKNRGFDWELHIDETPFDLWTVQGIRPPRAGTEDEKRWISENRPSPRTHD